MATIQNEKAVNFQNGVGRIYALGENKTDGITRLYTSVISAPDGGQTFNIGTIISPMRDRNDLNYTDGQYSSSTTSNQTLNVTEQDVSFRCDYVYNQDGGFVESTKNILINMMNATSFVDGADNVKVVGTNGVRLVNPAVSEHDIQYLFYNDGLLQLPQTDDGTGKPITKKNTLVASYNDQALCTAQEILTSYSSADRAGYRYGYVLSANADMGEADEANTITSNCTYMSGARSLDKFIIDGFGSYAQAVDSTDTLYKVDVTYIEEGSGLATPSATSEAGDTAAIVDTDTGNVSVFTDDGAGAWTEEAGATLGTGCVIHGKDEASSESKLIAVNNNGVAVDWFTDANGTGASTYLLEIKDWDFATEDWVVYTI